MFGCVLTVSYYVGVIMKLGKSVRGMWWSKTRDGVGDGDSGVCVWRWVVCVALPESVTLACTLGSRCVNWSCVSVWIVFLLFFAGMTLSHGSSRSACWCASAGCMERLLGASEELWAGSCRPVASRSCGGVGCVMGVLQRSKGNGFGG